MNLYKKYTSKAYSFLLNDTTLSSDNALRFRRNLMWKVIMTIDGKFRDEKL